MSYLQFTRKTSDRQVPDSLRKDLDQFKNGEAIVGPSSFVPFAAEETWTTSSSSSLFFTPPTPCDPDMYKVYKGKSNDLTIENIVVAKDGQRVSTLYTLDKTLTSKLGDILDVDDVFSSTGEIRLEPLTRPLHAHEQLGSIFKILRPGFTLPSEVTKTCIAAMNVIHSICRASMTIFKIYLDRILNTMDVNSVENGSLITKYIEQLKMVGVALRLMESVVEKYNAGRLNVKVSSSTSGGGKKATNKQNRFTKSSGLSSAIINKILATSKCKNCKYCHFSNTPSGLLGKHICQTYRAAQKGGGGARKRSDGKSVGLIANSKKFKNELTLKTVKENYAKIREGNILRININAVEKAKLRKNKRTRILISALEQEREEQQQQVPALPAPALENGGRADS